MTYAEPARAFISGASSELNRLRQRRKRRTYARLAAFIVDLLAITLAFLVASMIRFGHPHNQVLALLGIILPTYTVLASSHRCYSIASVLNAWRGGGRAVAAFAVTLSIVALTVFFLKVGAEFSRATFGVGSLIAVVTIPASRVLLAMFLRRALGSATPNQIVITDGAASPICDEAVILDVVKDGLQPRLDDPTFLDRLSRTIDVADRVIVVCTPERRLTWATILKGTNVRGEVLAPELDTLGTLGVGQYAEQSTLIVAAAPLGVVDRAVKRSFDIIVALVLLLALSPLMLILAAAIRIDSPGPILFRQQRVGLGNRLFQMYKFRSMCAERSDSYGIQSTGRQDDRVTRVGRFIRSTSLDELPQLFNVLAGAMSMVGPRPHALGSRAEDRLFWDIDSTYWHRHAVKPGLTGLAQVRGYRGATITRQDLTNRLTADIEYLSGWTIWRDIMIVASTFRVLIHRNAY